MGAGEAMAFTGSHPLLSQNEASITSTFVNWSRHVINETFTGMYLQVSKYRAIFNIT